MPNLYSPDDMNPGYLLNSEFYQLQFQKVQKTDLINLNYNLSISESKKDKLLFLKLENNKNELLSVFRLIEVTVNNIDYYKIDKSHSLVKRNGYGTILYEYSFCHLDLPIISDFNQTKSGSSDVWKKFKDSQKQSNYKIEILNKTTGHIGIYDSKNYNDYDIWGMNEQFIDTYRNFPDFIFDESHNGTNNYFEQNLYFEDSDEQLEYYENQAQIKLPTLSDSLRIYINNSVDKKTKKTKLSNREHILLIGSKK